MSHAAVLLAGGESSRMGRDKSALPVNGEPLWQRQLAVLRATEPAELFISGKSDGPYAGCGVEILPDEFPGCGPLGGIATALRRCKSDRLLVLAVDMPAMTAAFLRTLLEQSQRTGMGIIPAVAADGRRRADPKRGTRSAKRGKENPASDNFFEFRVPSSAFESSRLLPSAATNIEPLAAVYPRAALALADECLRAGEFKLEPFIRKLEAQGLAIIRPVEPGQAALFTNWNTPEELLRFRR